MGHDREHSSPAVICEECGAVMRPILGAPISDLGIYREVIGYRCSDPEAHHLARSASDPKDEQ